MTAVMRSPTRTKTKSLGGRQNDFKFPSIEALPRFVLHEEDLNNHYIVNEVFSKSPVLKARDDNESQLVSEYTSVSNTNTNTNSSNGYYSFANISDNTTASRMNGTLSEASYGVSSTTSRTYKSSDYSTAYDTEHPPFSSTASSSSHSPSPRLRPMNSDRTGTRPISAGSIVSKSTPPMEAILEDEQSLHSGEPLAYDVVELVPSSRVDPLPQARVVTVRSSSSITSSTTVESNHSVGVNEGNRQLSSDSSLTYTTAPSYNPLMEDSKGSYDPYSQVSGHQRQRQRQPGVRQVSKLKRSNAIRCKGGLLRFFSQLGIRIKRRFRRLWLAVRRKLFSYSRGRSSGSISRSKSMHSVSQSLVRRQTFATEQSTLENITLRKRHRVNGHEMKRSLSSGNKLTTSHLRRTHGLVSNLQSLPPQDSAAVATTDLSIISSIKSPGTPQRVSFGKHGTSSTLRRTNSSIRRAASILEASMSKMDHSHNGLPMTTSWKLDTLQESPELEAGSNKPNTQLLTKDQLATGTTLQNKGSNDKPSANLRRPSHLVRSRGSNSLSSIIRQPSIVVKNKVIPLSMCNYSMSVRNGNRVACWDTLSAVESQSSIDSSYFEVNQPLSGGKDDGYGRITVVRGTSKDFEREKDKAMETIEEKANDEEEDTTELVPNRETVSSLFNSYFRRIIYERVKLQLQMDRLQESSQEDICSIYRELLDSIHVYEDGAEEEEEEEQDEVEEEEGQRVAANDIVAVNHGDYKVRGRQLSTEMFVFPSEVVSRESDSDVVSRLAPALYNSRRGSILSIPGSTVGRSLTLPMGIKV